MEDIFPAPITVEESTEATENLIDRKKSLDAATRKFYRLRIQKRQKIIATLTVFQMVIGGSAFILGVLIRPILRLVWPYHRLVVSTGLDILLAIGILQISSAAFSCFCSVWELNGPIYAAIAGSIGIICFGLVGISYGIYLFINTENFSTEKVYKAWYIWECEKFGSCSSAYFNYFKVYIIPQGILIIIAIIFQIFLIYHLNRILKTLKDKQKRCISRRIEANIFQESKL